MVQRTHKRCYVCKTTKPTSEFYRSGSKKDGLRSECKTCHTVLARRYIVRVARGPVRSPVRSRTEYERARPHTKVYARKSVRRYIRRHNIVRGKCFNCGGPSTHAHHLDYNKRLEIVWLCDKCHAAVHRKHEPLDIRPYIKNKVKIGRLVVYAR